MRMITLYLIFLQNFSVMFICVLIFQIISISQASSTFNEELTLSQLEYSALAKFKEIMLPKIKVDYMKDDIYLIKWLRSQKLDIDRARNRLSNHLSWRESTNFDRLTDSDFQEFVGDYPYEITGVNKDGRPLLQFYSGIWDLRKAALAGKMDKLLLYASKMLEKAWLRVRDFQMEGKNVTRFAVIIDLDKVNVRQNLNIASTPFYAGIVLAYELQFPKQAEEVIIVNCPSFMEVPLNLAKSVMDAETKRNLKVYGTNKEIWAPILHETIDPSQLTAPFGGTLPSEYGF
ncbi:SEC14-like protein 4 [Folsomia candida]|uniref:SEC14-like protein 4 n=1 Tax=Folsomia candida TaxID=158441 RepID=UPI000B8FDCC6|nr:SEC14-like protein 4 [Folsomia candida]